MSKKALVPIILVPIIFIVTAVIVAVSLTQTGPISGKVSYDGKVVKNVSVSDGSNVVKTDENGDFKLKGYRKTRFITVTVPAGYEAEKYYISADKKKSDGYDFELKESNIKAGDAHSFLQISDTEIGKDGVGKWINYLKDITKNEKPAFLIHTGDICYEDGLKRHIKDMNSENMGLPVKYIIGNHDYVDGKYGEELFESIYGPVWYSFEVGNVHYIVTPFQTGSDYKSGYNKNDRWRWLENDLKNTDENMKIVMFNHTTPPNDDYVIKFDRKELDLKKHNLIAWVFGHYHYNYIKDNDGVLSISTARPDCGGIDSSVSGARMINIDKDGNVTTDMHYYNFDKPIGKIDNAKWSTQLDGNVLFCDTVVENDNVYVATVDEDYPRNCGIYCLNTKDGNIIWKYETKNSVKNNIIVDGDRLVAQDCDGNVYCLNTNDGKEVWKKKVNLSTNLNTSTGICVDKDIIYAGSPACITALKYDNGEVVWENERGTGECSPAEFIVIDDKLIVNSHWDALVALDKKTGKQLWENKDEDIRFRSSTPVQINEKSLLVADSDAIMIVDLSSGEITTKKDYDGKYNFSSSAKPYIRNNKAFIPTATTGLVIFDLEKKEIIKEVKVGKDLIYTAPYTNNDAQTVAPTLVQSFDGKTLLFGASDGYLYEIDEDGNIVSKNNIGSPVFSSVSDGDYEGDTIVSDFSGRVSLVKLK